jgi:hypothetical protein
MRAGRNHRPRRCRSCVPLDLNRRSAEPALRRRTYRLRRAIGCCPGFVVIRRTTAGHEIAVSLPAASCVIRALLRTFHGPCNHGPGSPAESRSLASVLHAQNEFDGGASKRGGEATAAWRDDAVISFGPNMEAPVQ